MLKAIAERFKTLNETCLIGTLNTMQPKHVLRVVGKEMGVSNFTINNLCKEVVMISTQKVTLPSSLADNKNLRDLINKDHQLAKLYEEAELIEGLPFTHGVHAAGIVLVPRNKLNFLPISYGSEHELPVIQLDKKEIEFFGLVKVDLLGVDSLSIIQKCCQQLNVNVLNLDLQDKATFQGLNEKSTFSLFQISNRNSFILKSIGVSSISEVAEVLGLNRPGSMTHIPEYISRKRGAPCELTIPHETFKEVVRETQGIIIWQEQVMTMVIRMCGYSSHDADTLRKVIAKKEMSLMAAEREKIIQGAERMGFKKYGESI